MRKVAHQTLGALKHAVAEEDSWDFKPGQRVVADGFPGTVTAVQDGPFGNESYEVTLDDGMGGGEYNASQLTAQPSTEATRKAAEAPSVELEPVEAGSTALANHWYPELGTILTDRPPIERIRHTASLQRVGSDDENSHVIRSPHGYIDYTHNPGSPSVNEVWWVEKTDPDARGVGMGLVEQMQQRHPADEIHWGGVSESGRDLMQKFHRAHPEVRGRWADNDGNPKLAFGSSEQHTASLHRTASDDDEYYALHEAVNQVLSDKQREMNEHWAQHHDDEENIRLQSAKEDLAGLAENADLNVSNGAHQEHGYTKAQFLHASLADHPYYPEVVAKLNRHTAAVEPGMVVDQDVPSVCSFCGNPGPWTDEQDTGRGTRIRCGTCGGTMRLNQDDVASTSGIQWQPEFPNSPENAASRAGDPRAKINTFDSVHASINPVASQQAGYTIFHAPDLAAEAQAKIVTTAASLNGVADEDFVFQFTATWADVQEKAKRIRAEGGVRILASSGLGVVGEVQGDTALYESVLNYVPGSRKVAAWTCGCKWGAYAWGRSPAYRRFEGRQCSHVLALQYEAGSRGMFGREVTPDSNRLYDQHPHAPVTVQYQRPTERHPGGNINRRTVPPGNMRREWAPNSRVRVKGSLVMLANEEPWDVDWKAEDEGRKQRWEPGERAHYEYHCYESPESQDADLWYRSHRPVTVGERDTNGAPESWSAEHRSEGGNPHTYKIRFDDGHEGTAFEDELLVHPKHYSRPDPPSMPKESSLAPVHEWARYLTALGSSPSEVLTSLQALGVLHKDARAAIDWATKSPESAEFEVDGIVHHALAIQDGQIYTQEGAVFPAHTASLRTAKPEQTATAYPGGGTAQPGTDIPRLDQRDKSDLKRKKHHTMHHTNDSRQHAPNFGYGLPWGGLYAWCGQCNGSGCGHCAGTGQVAVGDGLPSNPSDLSSTETPVPDQSVDAGDAVGSDGLAGGDGMSAAASLRTAAFDQETCPHDQGFNLHGQCKRCGYIEPTEEDEPCDNPWCIHNEPEHTKGEHIDPPHLDPYHEDYQSAERSIEEALGNHPDAWLIHHQSDGPSKYSSAHTAVDERDLMGWFNEYGPGGQHLQTNCAACGARTDADQSRNWGSTEIDPKFLCESCHRHASALSGWTEHGEPTEAKPRTEYEKLWYAPGEARTELPYTHERLHPFQPLPQSLNSLQHQADYSSNDFFAGEPAGPEQRTPHIRSGNPGSTGWATTADPDGWAHPIMDHGFSTWSALQTASTGNAHQAKAAESAPPSVAGVALKAADTGRVLMIQRSFADEKDPARGTWEFPGGHKEDGDQTSLHTGIREWEEEVGHPFPEGGHLTHVHRNGPYVLHTVVIPEESAVDFSNGRRTVNPDDPDGDDHEQSAWWDPEHARKNPALRQECKVSPWGEIKKAASKTASVPGWEGSVGPFPSEYTLPHVYARDIHSGAGNCVCGSGTDDPVHVQVAPGYDRRTARYLTVDEVRAVARAEEERTGKTSEQLLREHVAWQEGFFQPTTASVMPVTNARGDDEFGTYDLAYVAGYNQATLHDEPEPALPSTDGAAEDDDVVDPDPAQDEPLEAVPGLDTGRDVPWGYPESAADHPDPAVAQPGPALDQPDEQPVEDGGLQVSSSIPDYVDPEMAMAIASQPVLAGFTQTAGFRALMTDAKSDGGGVAVDGVPNDADIAAAARELLQKTSMKDFSYAEQQELITEGGGKVRARNMGGLRIEGTHYEKRGDDDEEGSDLAFFL